MLLSQTLVPVEFLFPNLTVQSGQIAREASGVCMAEQGGVRGLSCLLLVIMVFLQLCSFWSDPGRQYTPALVGEGNMNLDYHLCSM